MLRKLLLAVATFIITMGIAFAQVEVNKADQAALDSVRGIGPTLSKKLLDERKKSGDFKDWDDLRKRINGIGDKKSTQLSQAGLTVNGQSKPNAPPAKEAKKDAKASAKVAKTDAKDSKKDVKPEASK